MEKAFDRQALLDRITFREATQDDYNFIYSSWLKSYRNSIVTREMPNDIFFKEQQEVISSLLGDSTVILACDKNDTTNIIGYIVVAKVQGLFVLHFLYVKHTYRRLGIANILMHVFKDNFKDNKCCFTHQTYTGNMMNVKYKFAYNPFMINHQLLRIQDNKTKEELEKQNAKSDKGR